MIEVCTTASHLSLPFLTSHRSSSVPTGHGGFSGEGSCQSHWYLQLHHHQDREPIEDSQDCPGCEPGGVSSIFPATQAEGIL